MIDSQIWRAGSIQVGAKRGRKPQATAGYAPTPVIRQRHPERRKRVVSRHSFPRHQLAEVPEPAVGRPVPAVLSIVMIDPF